MTYPMSGSIPQYAKYVGEFVPSDDTIQYQYRVVAYDRNSNPITDLGDTPIAAYGPVVLDGRHAVSVNWSPVIGAAFFIVFKGVGAAPPSDITTEGDIWHMASASETGILDVGYPASTRGADQNPGISPLYAAACCGDPNSVATNVPPVGMAPPVDTFPGGGYVRVAGAVTTFSLNPSTPGGADGSVQFNDQGRFGGDPNLYWDNVNKRLGIRNPTPQFPLDVND